MTAETFVTMVYRPDDFDPGPLAATLAGLEGKYAEVAARSGFRFRFVPVSELVPTSIGGPRLWWRGEDLLATPQCFQVDEFSSCPQTAQFLDAVRRCVAASDSVLLNSSFEGPPYLASDKMAMANKAAALGLPVAGMICVPYGRYARTVVDAVRAAFGPGPYIVKPREMGMGYGVVKVDSVEQLGATLDMVAQTGTGYVVQQFLPNDGDIRVYVVDGEVVCAQHRRAQEGNYLANLSQGGSSVVGTDIAEVTAMSKVVATDLRAAALCVDWLLTPEGPVLNEWSAGFGGFAGLPTAERFQVGDAVLAWARRQLSPN
ncbi:ATP-grasp domain-containing protein [Actinokineospora sp. HUAS TT18]|uniref:ATP-grasp domain-containing protein n=1 Tax=Actinokineospora sp. HUAS TT18 TaxID=3447451 RepID=UPI003F52147F